MSFLVQSLYFPFYRNNIWSFIVYFLIFNEIHLGNSTFNNMDEKAKPILYEYYIHIHSSFTRRLSVMNVRKGSK